MNILLAEDDTPTRMMLQSLLSNWGYSVTSVSDGDKAWQILCGTEHPHLLILDWMMPGVEGPEIVRRLREREPDNLYYAIIITSRDIKDSAARALNAGADDFVGKPFNSDELRARVAVGHRVRSLLETLINKLHQLEVATETISRQARTDELTGLHNRRSFREILTLALSAARRHHHPLALISIDLDHFKNVNDTLGHSTGDLVLKEFAMLMRELIRSEDVAVRLGGEEFMILLPHADCAAAAALAERIRTAFAQNRGSAAPLTVTASFGVAQLQDREEEDALMRRADAALYRAKEKGRNRVVTAEDELHG